MKNLFIFLSLFCLYSCIDTEYDTTNRNVDNDAPFKLNVTYNGISYDVTCLNDVNGDLVFLDTDFAQIYQDKIQNNQNTVLLDVGVDSIAYFDSLDDMQKTLGCVLIDSMPSLETQSAVTRVSPVKDPVKGYARLWDDTGFKDRSIEFHCLWNNASSSVYEGRTLYSCHPVLKNYHNFNDKTSALKVYSYLPTEGKVQLPDMPGNPDCPWSKQNGSWTWKGDDPVINGLMDVDVKLLDVVLLCYQHTDYQGKILCCIPEHGGAEHSHKKLRSLGWNDEISSVKFMLMYGNSREQYFRIAR